MTGRKPGIGNRKSFVSVAAFLSGVLVAAPVSAVTGPHDFRVLDDFSKPSSWTATASDQVGATLRPADGPNGRRALCLDYDFHGVSG